MQINVHQKASLSSHFFLKANSGFKHCTNGTEIRRACNRPLHIQRLERRGGGVLGINFAGYVLLASQNLYIILIIFNHFFVAILSNFRNPNLATFCLYIYLIKPFNLVTLKWTDSFVTALFTNMRILKFKSQLTIAFFAAVNHLNGPLRKQNFTLTGSKGQGLWFVIGGFRSVLCVSGVSRFVACDCNYNWRQRKTQLWKRLLNFRVRMFVENAVNLMWCKSFRFISLHTWIFWPRKSWKFATPF